MNGLEDVSTEKDADQESLNEESRHSVFRHVFRATVALELGLGLQRGIFNNFVVEVLGVQPAQLGFVQGIREVPGLLTAPLAVVSGYFRENVWAGICILVASLGLLLHAVTFSFPMLVVATLVLSTGFHLFYPVQQSIIVKSSLPKERATRMGQLNSGAAAASLVSLLAVMAITRLGGATRYGLLHLMASGIALVGGIAVLARRMPGIRAGRSAMNYNPRYMSYYVMTLLGGVRRHVTGTFGGYLLVEVFKTSVSTMVLLTAVSSLVAIFTRPVLGKIIDRWGEQRSLVVNYSIVACLFMSYAFLKSPISLYVVYILDNGLVGFDVAITTHLGKIAPKGMLSSAYAMGSTINHITGVSVPILGGFLWDRAGAATVFFFGAAMAVASMMYSMRLSRVERALAN